MLQLAVLMKTKNASGIKIALERSVKQSVSFENFRHDPVWIGVYLGLLR